MHSKSLIVNFFLTVIFLLVSYIGFFCYFDSMGILRNKDNKDYFISGSMRLLSKGMIDNWDYNSLILGSSMLENTSAKETGTILEGKFINISLSGSDFLERKLVMGYALNQKSLNKIIYSLDESGLIDSRRGLKDFSLLSFNYLYDNNYLNNFKGYLTVAGAKHTIRTVKCRLNKKKCKWIVDGDRPNAWYRSNAHAKRFGGLDNWFKAKNNWQIKSAFSTIVSTTKKIEKGEVAIDNAKDEKIAISKIYLNETIIDYAKKYPNTEFILIIPPYSRMHNAIDVQYNKPKFERVKQSIRYLVDASSRIKNIKVYGWGDTNYPDDIAHYKDLTHYHYSFNSQMLKYIKEKKGLLTNQNINKYLEVFTQKSLDYDVVSIGKRIEAYLNNIVK